MSFYLMENKLPLFWCAGCGNGIILGSVLRAMNKLGFTRENTVIVTGIGCWGKADDYIDVNTFHGTHGRALPFATGIKLANPALNVIVLMGDGDGITIGGNHFIHAARRNVDLTVILANNLNYGMTGGQYSGTTPQGAITKTSPYGHVEPSFDICRIADAAGGAYIARGTVYDVVRLDSLICEAMTKTGFSMVEVISACPTQYGRNNRMAKPVQYMNWIKENSVSTAKAASMSEEELKGKYVTGVIKDRQVDDYGELYRRIIEAQTRGNNEG